ncbi:hypothetical protein C0989_009870 [Termitomyces sp. Mn162]|nr:hypothetical protein C0989_009870 [Termitomyces sp. Mn162]
MSNAENGARIKAWAGPNVGSGIVENITFQNFIESEVDNPVIIDQHIRYLDRFSGGRNLMFSGWTLQ